MAAHSSNLPAASFLTPGEMEPTAVLTLITTFPERRNKPAWTRGRSLKCLGARDTADWTYHKHTYRSNVARSAAKPGFLPKTKKRDSRGPIWGRDSAGALPWYHQQLSWTLHTGIRIWAAEKQKGSFWQKTLWGVRAERTSLRYFLPSHIAQPSLEPQKHWPQQPIRGRGAPICPELAQLYSQGTWGMPNTLTVFSWYWGNSESYHKVLRWSD